MVKERQRRYGRVSRVNNLHIFTQSLLLASKGYWKNKFPPKPVLHGCLSSPKLMLYRFLLQVRGSIRFWKNTTPSILNCRKRATIKSNLRVICFYLLLLLFACFCFNLLQFASICFNLLLFASLCSFWILRAFWVSRNLVCSTPIGISIVHLIHNVSVSPKNSHQFSQRRGTNRAIKTARV
jgi:hypothetical protein